MRSEFFFFGFLVLLFVCLENGEMGDIEDSLAELDALMGDISLTPPPAGLFGLSQEKRRK